MRQRSKANVRLKARQHCARRPNCAHGSIVEHLSGMADRSLPVIAMAVTVFAGRLRDAWSEKREGHEDVAHEGLPIILKLRR